MIIPPLGLGIGWRPELALFIDRRADLGFVEIVAENVDVAREIPPPLARLGERGVRIIPHGVSLSLGSPERPDRSRIARLASLARAFDSPLVSEHIAFVRAGGIEAGHLVPVPRTRAQLRVLVENIRATQALLPVPLAVENIAALLEWPGAEMDEATFLAEIVEQTGVHLLLDLANVHTNALNFGGDAEDALGDVPLDRIAYVHVAGGEARSGLYHDTHAHRTPPEVLHLVESLLARRDVPGVMLERDDHFPDDAELDDELAAIAASIQRGRAARHADII